MDFRRLMIPETLLSSAFSVIVALTLTPVISRLYGPVSYGQFAVAYGAATIAATFSQFALPSAIAHETRLIARLRLTAALMKTSLLAGLGTLAVLIFSAQTELGGPLTGSLATIALASMIAVATSIFRISSSWSTAQGFFKPQVTARVTGTAIIRPMSIVLGNALAPKAPLMLLAELIGLILQIAILARSTGLRIGRVIARRYIRRVSMIAEVRGRYVFSGLEFPSQLLLLASTVLPPIVLGWRFGPDWAGWTSLGLALIGMPVQLISLAIAPAMLFQMREATEMGDQHASKFLHKVFLVLVVLGTVGYGLLAVIAHWLLPSYLGEDWRVTGMIAAWLCLPFAIHFATYPFHMLHRQVGRNHWRLTVDAVFSLLSLGALTLEVVAVEPLSVIRFWALALSLHRVGDLLLLLSSRSLAERLA